MSEQTRVGLSTRQVWFDGRPVPLEQHDLWSLIHNSNITKVVVNPAQRHNGNFPLKTELITEIMETSDLDGIPTGEIVLSENGPLLEAAKEKGYRTCISFFIKGTQDDLEKASLEAMKHDFAIVDFDLPTNIPLELIIARLQDSKTVLLKRESTYADMEVAFGVLEKGSDGVLLATTDFHEIIKASDYVSLQDKTTLDLCPLLVKEVRHIGMGLRACIDTTGIMKTDEGMIVGSTSNGGIFVCSETHFLPYMNLRPFRVNAGAVHSYVWAPNNATEYLTDLRAGSQVLCVNTKGETRKLIVGRIKTEVRPLLLIRGIAAETPINVIVQDDWHIRVMDVNGQPRNATTVQPGDQLLAYVCEPGRHVGIKVNEQILEY
ncbi:3-dehydroquinate synthase [Heliobacillus mobilis]|uniref:3-dehydroquinate synthase n=1 Tax=Heliobacterium mobile TaxID=28064 RepID=A0A6I3SN22_HELMO|nr:3-dehydroquinate synthase II [Heliobacterium mobile]MTV50400.1 3-dehydroquinate synthase [Heliobacterium mobile]